MQESMMIAEVGGMVKVRGSRIATPLAPPSPGSTPMSTPRTTPTSIRRRLNGDRATAKPCIKALISSKTRTPCDPLVQAEQGLERALGQRNPEPHLEQQERDHAHPARHQRRPA